ncbi:MAG: sugar-binding protein, partial [Lentisphaerota bacterium]
YLEGLVIDGKTDDWGDRGFRVDWMNVRNNNPRLKPEDFEPRLRLGWNQQGIFILVSVTDDSIYETISDNLRESDSIEIFLTEKAQVRNSNQFVITPGLNTETGAPRIKKQNSKTEIESASASAEKGYVCEFFLPWKNLNKTPSAGDIVFFQIYVNEKDRNGKSSRYLFHPLEEDDDYINRNNLYPLRLSKLPSYPIVSRNEVRWDGKINTLEITGIRELTGMDFTVKTPGRELSKGKMGLTGNQDFSYGKTALPAPLPNEYLSDFEIEFGNGMKTKGVASSFKPINLSTVLEAVKVGDDKIKLNIDIASCEKTGYYFSSPLAVRCTCIDAAGKDLSETRGDAGKDFFLQIPKCEKGTMLIRLCDSEDDVIAGRVLSLQNGMIASALPDSKGRPAIIAISGIAPLNWMLSYFRPLHMNDIFSLRDRLSSVLVSNYDCIALSRARGYNMSVENSINKIAQIMTDNYASTSQVPQVPAADFMITGHYNFTGRENPIYIDKDFTCELMLNEIGAPNKSFRKFDVLSDPSDYWRIAAPVISAMNLQARTSFGATVERLDETWAVLPFTAMDISKESKEISSSIGINMEMSLQESGKIARLVSHDKIENILLEMKINSLNGATESLAGDIARIAGADRVIMGTLSKYFKNRYQLLLFIVDGKNSVILDSASAICLEGAIADSASLLALKLTERKYELPAIPSQSDESR